MVDVLELELDVVDGSEAVETFWSTVFLVASRSEEPSVFPEVDGSV